MVKIDDIINVEFSRSIMGYDVKEVDVFLDAVIEQFEAFDNERKEMLTALEYLLHELEQIEQSPGQANRRMTDSAAGAAKSRAKQTAAKLRSNMRRVPADEPAARGTAAGSGWEQETSPIPRQTVPADEPDVPTYVFAGEEDAQPAEAVAEEFETGDAAPGGTEGEPSAEPFPGAPGGDETTL